MELLAFASFAILVVGWLVAPSRTVVASSEAAEERAAA
jgi:hypothetical protein